MTDSKDALLALAVDAKGYCWRVFDDGTWSMCATNPDNEPVPQPVTFYVRQTERDAWARCCSAAATLGAALAEFDNAREFYARVADTPKEGTP